jgi:hypothetical protein
LHDPLQPALLHIDFRSFLALLGLPEAPTAIGVTLAGRGQGNSRWSQRLKILERLVQTQLRRPPKARCFVTDRWPHPVWE